MDCFRDIDRQPGHIRVNLHQELVAIRQAAGGDQFTDRNIVLVEENQRVLDIADAMTAGEHLRAGQLAMESFQGARDLYEIVSQEMIAVYDAIMSAPGVYGARGAGAGFGGCLVAFVGSDSIDSFAEYVHEQYIASTGIKPEIYPVQAAQGAGVLSFE